MRIGLVVEQFDPRRGGLEQWSAQFVRRLSDGGHQVHVVAGRFGEAVHAMPIVAHRLEGAHSRLGFAEAAQRKLQSLELDVIHDTGAGWYCDVFQPHGGSRRASIEQNLMLLPRWMRPLKRAVGKWLPRYRRFDALCRRQYVDDGRIVLALSRRVAADFQRYHGVPTRQIRLVYNGVDTERFSPAGRPKHRGAIRRRLGLEDGTLLLLIVAHNFRLKGVPALLRAVARLAARRLPVHLAVVGGKRLRGYQRAAGRLGAAGAVTFIGPVDDAVPYYAAADAYVQPTFYDPCSLVVLEALASGLPVITSCHNGAGELMAEGLEGHILSDPADVDELLGRLETLFDASRRRRMGEAARRLALKHTLEKNCDQILDVYREVANRRRRAA